MSTQQTACDWYGQTRPEHSWVDVLGGRRCIHCKQEEVVSDQPNSLTDEVVRRACDAMYGYELSSEDNTRYLTDAELMRAALIASGLVAENDRLRQLIADQAKNILSHVTELSSLRERQAECASVLKTCRDDFAGLPHSLGYEFTHLPKIDAAIAASQKDGTA